MTDLVSHHATLEAAYNSVKARMENCSPANVQINTMRRHEVIRKNGTLYIVPGIMKVICTMPDIGDPGDPALRTALVGWDKPLRRNNGELLLEGEIGFYRIAYKEVGTEVETLVEVPADNLSKVISGLSTSKDYTFAVQTVTSTGLGGEYSNPVILTRTQQAKGKKNDS